jgi:hypothetical protein
VDPSIARYGDLFDIENRPGAGVKLWGKAVAKQYDAVVDANYRHRRNHDPGRGDEVEDDPDAESELHIAVYFLALTIRRVLLFHEAIAKLIDDPALHQAGERFLATARDARTLRNFFEHLDEYLLDSPNKHIKMEGRASPILLLVWEADNVVVAFGDRSLDVTLAAKAAIALADETAAIWLRHMEDSRPKVGRPPRVDDGVPRTLEVTMSPSTIIGEGGPAEVRTGILLRAGVREATPEEAAQYERKDGSDPPSG